MRSSTPPLHTSPPYWKINIYNIFIFQQGPLGIYSNEIAKKILKERNTDIFLNLKKKPPNFHFYNYDTNI